MSLWKALSVQNSQDMPQKKKGVQLLARARRAYRRTQRNWFTIALVVIVVLTLTFIIPFFQETEIHVQIGYTENIMNVWVDTPRKPLISYLFPPSYPLGAYTL